MGTAVPAEAQQLLPAITDWFSASARDLPWRRAGCPAWHIMVSEFMLQQTPVARVLPVWRQWVQRWPVPAALAAEPSGEAVRLWGQLGYPRRALRLHQAAAVITAQHNGEVPDTYAQLLQLPGVGTYTAAAIASFAFGRRELVIDTNVRRVLARLITGNALPAPALTAAETRLGAAMLPAGPEASVSWNAAVMELGAVICTARSPKCGQCPVQTQCAWLAAGKPEPHYTPKGQAWAGTDRQVRGAIMAVLRAAEAPVGRATLLEAPADLQLHDGPACEAAVLLRKLHGLRADPEQLARALEGLLADKLAQADGHHIRLPA